MKKCELIVPVYEFRPLPSKRSGDLFRYNNGNWIVDDGEYDLAFVYPCQSTYYGVKVPHRENIIWSWVKNGKWGAYCGDHPRGNAWHYMLRDGETKWGETWSQRRHINRVAYESACKFVLTNGRSASGGGPEFHINDPCIAEGLVRLRETKEVVKFPDIFNCMYCGEINWQEAEKDAPQ